VAADRHELMTEELACSIHVNVLRQLGQAAAPVMLRAVLTSLIPRRVNLLRPRLVVQS